MQSRIYVERTPASGGGRTPSGGGTKLAFGFALAALAVAARRQPRR